MAAVQLIEKWGSNDFWEITGPHSIDIEGNLHLDADTNGIISTFPNFSDHHYATGIQGLDNSGSGDLRIIEFTVTVSGSMSFMLGISPAAALVSYNRLEIYTDGAGLRFYAKGVSGFDGQTLVVGNSIKIRVASINTYSYGTTAFSVAICSTDGTLIASSDFPRSLDAELSGVNGDSYYGDTSNSIGDLSGGSNTFLYPVIVAKTGTLTISPLRIIADATNTSTLDAVNTGTSPGLVTVAPAAPTLSVTKTTSGVDQITFLPQDAASVIIMTRNRGMFFTDVYSLMDDNYRITSLENPTGLIVSTYPAVYRAVQYNGMFSTVTTQYIGPPTDVAIPEISVNRESLAVHSGSVCIQMYCMDTGASIYYTVDGTEPTASSLLYTEPLFLKSAALIRAKSIKGALSSITVNSPTACYSSYEYPLANGLRVPNPFDASMWLYEGSGTVSATTISVNDPTGQGVAFREDIFAQQDCKDTFGAVVRSSFKVSGPFRLKSPGIAPHLAWVGNFVGLVPDTATTPTNSMGGAVYARVVFENGSITVTGYTAGDVVCATVVIPAMYDDPVQWWVRHYNYITLPGGIYSNVLCFTSEGVSPYDITELTLEILAAPTSAAKGLAPIASTPLIDTVNARDIAGSGVLRSDNASLATKSMAYWDVIQDWPTSWKYNIDHKLEGITLGGSVIRTPRCDAGLKRFGEYKAIYSGTTTDVGAAWFSIQISQSRYGPLLAGFVTVGWSLPGHNLVPSACFSQPEGISGEMDFHQRLGGSTKSSVRLVNTSDWTAHDTLLRSVADESLWRCGRKTVAGHLYLRTIIMQSNYTNSIEYDSGWQDVGVVPTVMPRPQVVYKLRSNLSGARLERSLSDMPLPYVIGGLTDAQVDSCMAYGAVTPPPTPTFAVGAKTANGTYPVTVTSAGASIIIVSTGNRPATTLSSNNSSNEIWRVSSGSSVNVPDLSSVKAVALSSTTYPGFSAVGNLDIIPALSSLISVATRPGILTVRVLANAFPYIPYKSPNNNVVDTYWALNFNNGQRIECTLALPGNIEVAMEPGNYSMWLTRNQRGNRNAGVLGTTEAMDVTIPGVLDVTVSAPTSFALGDPGVFQASCSFVGAQYHWKFSTGPTYDTSSVTASFTKPGKYRWDLTVSSGLGESVTRFGFFVVTFSPGVTAPTAMRVNTEVRVS